MKDFIKSYLLVISILLGTSISLFAQDWKNHSDPQKVWEGGVVMKAPHQVELAVEEFIRTNIIAILLDFEYTGYTINWSGWDKYNKETNNPPNESSLFCCVCTGKNGKWYWVIVTGTGEVLDFTDGARIDYEGEQFNHPTN